MKFHYQMKVLVCTEYFKYIIQQEKKREREWVSMYVICNTDNRKEQTVEN